jgi:hypothetical protein
MVRLKGDAMPLPGPNVEGDGGTWAMAVAVGSMFVNIVVAICTGVWTLGRTRNATDERIAEKEKTVAGDLTALERRLEESINVSTDRFGETVAAIRAKITETELWNRDNFVSKQTFQVVIGDIKRSWERFEDQLKERFDKIDEKLDQRNKTD